jgi:hypothetical protein
MLGDIPARFTPEAPPIQYSRFDLRILAFRTDSNHSASVLLLLSHSGPPTRRLRSRSVDVRVHFEVAPGLYSVTYAIRSVQLGSVAAAISMSSRSKQFMKRDDKEVQ